jgi:hypothetical protein
MVLAIKYIDSFQHPNHLVKKLFFAGVSHFNNMLPAIITPPLYTT